MAKSKRKKKQTVRASDVEHPSAPFTGPPELRRCAWKWETTKDSDDEELPKSEWVPVKNCCVLAPGQTRGSETEWLAYFAEAENCGDRYKMVLKHADICFDKHPFNDNVFQNRKATVVARWFARAGMPVQPYTKPGYVGWRTHQDNEGYQPRGHGSGLARGRLNTSKFFADARAEGKHYDRHRVQYAEGEASESARRHFIACPGHQ